MAGFGDYALATKFRDLIAAQISKETERIAPRIQYGTVNTIDRANLKCTVTMVGDSAPITVKMGTIQPNAVGNIVRVDGPLGDRYISEVLAGNAYMAGISTAIGTSGFTVAQDGVVRLAAKPGNAAIEISAWLDFHRGRAADEATDYDVRLENNADGYLTLFGGRYRVGWAEMGTHPVHTNYAWFGRTAQAGASDYAFLTNGSETIINSNDNTYISRAGAWKCRLDASGFFIDDDIGIPSDRAIYLKGAWDGVHIIHHWSAMDGFIYATWAEHRFKSVNVDFFRVGSNAGGILCQSDWIRSSVAGTLVYNNAEGCGLRASNSHASGDGIETQHNETKIMARKISQGGWATSGLESFGEGSTCVPWMTLHASGCCTSSWRKDANESYMVVINSGGGCDWVYAANHPICSEEQRKHNISVIDEYGLKTLRKLQVKRFQYTPSDESEIWQWELWKHDQQRGYWKYPPNEHMNWDTWHIGYMAEEMANLVPEVVGYYSDGRPKGIDYGNLIVVVISALNELADRVEDLEAELERYRARAA